MGRRWRVFLASPGIRRGDRIELPSGEAHHVHRVLRLHAGERVALFDGAGREWWSTIAVSSADGVTVEVGEEIHDPVESPLEVTLFQGWCEPARMEWILQKGTELGLSAIHPLVASGASRGRLSATRLERWRRIVAEACKQSGRRRFPRLEPMESIPPPEAATPALLLDASAGTAPLDERLRGEAPRGVWLAVGSAGGLRQSEVTRLTECGWEPVRLGPRTLRAETAALAAATVVLHRWGDLGTSSVRSAG